MAFIIFAVSALLGLIEDQNVGPGILAAVVLFGFGVYWTNVGLRLKAAPVTLTQVPPQVLPQVRGEPVTPPQVREGPVLYLRAFDAENRPFVTGPKHILRDYTSKPIAWMFLPKSRGMTIKLTFEEFFARAISQRIGPFIGLGNPSDTLPPDGAVREYAEDIGWQKRFTELADSAKCIVLNAGDSANLQWELAHIRRIDANRKLCMFTSPRNFQSNVSDLLRAEDSNREALMRAWGSATQVLGHAGFECQPVCPGFGAVLSFDDAGKSVLLTTDSSTPEDFVAPLADWIVSGNRTGKCIPATCGSCGSSTYVSPNGPPSSARVLCFVCAQKEQLGRKGFVGRAFDRHPLLSAAYCCACVVIVLPILQYALHVDDPGFFTAVLAAVPLMCIPWGLSVVVRRLKTGSFRTPET
jgi:hypothetical protein